MKLRTKEKINGDNNSYSFNIAYLRSKEIKGLVEKYSNLVEEIMNKKKQKEDISEEIKELDKIKQIIKESQSEESKNKNILKCSDHKDVRIGKGKDSSVYEFKKRSRYIYKEGKESNVKNIEYLKKKYKILKKYLGDIIPKSYFVLGESFSQLRDRGLKGNKYIETKSITIQSKIKGKDLSQMKTDEKTDYKFLLELEKSHKKYVLLKLFLQSILKELDLSKKDMDLQLDLGLLSNMDIFHYDNLDFVEGRLRSPNIMWDQKKISFIDFGQGEWDEKKEIIFNKMMEKKTIKKWEKMLDNFSDIK